MKISPRPLGEGLGVRGYFRISQHELRSPPRMKISPRPLGEELATHHHTQRTSSRECDDASGVRGYFRISQHELRSPPRMKISPRPLGEGLGVRGYFRIRTHWSRHKALPANHLYNGATRQYSASMRGRRICAVLARHSRVKLALFSNAHNALMASL